jgi:hypothetical protein
VRTRLHRVAAAAFLAGACGGKATGPATPTSPATGSMGAAASDGFQPAPLYAGLFLDDARYRYRGKLEVEEGDEEGEPGPRKVTPLAVSCVVREVSRSATEVRATFACDGEAGEELTNRFVASAAGLFQIDEHQAEERRSPFESAPVLTASPVVGRTVLQNDEDGVAEIAVTTERGATCFETRSLFGDESTWQMCLEGGRPVRLESSFEGSSSRRIDVALEP